MNDFNGTSTPAAQQVSALLAPFGITTTTPPPINTSLTMQRADEVNTILQMLTNRYTSTLLLIGTPGAGKSTLATLLYQRLQLARETNQAAPRYLLWLGTGPYTTLLDIIAAILDGIGMQEPNFFQLKPEQQIAALLRALRRPQETALIILDQFEWLLRPQSPQELAMRGPLLPFLEMLQTDLGPSRVLLTAFDSPYDNSLEETRIRPYLVSRISMPEGVLLLQQRGVQGSPAELSLVWQRCTGHIFTLTLFSTFCTISGIALSYLLNAPDYQPFWTGDVTSNIIAAIYYYLNPTQIALLRALSLFDEPVPLPGIIVALTADATAAFDPQSRPYIALQQELNALLQLSLVQLCYDKQRNPCFTIHSSLNLFIQEHYANPQSRQNMNAGPLLGNAPLLDMVPGNPQETQAAIASDQTKVATYYQLLARQHCPPRLQRRSPCDIEPLLAMTRHLCLAMRRQQAYDLVCHEGLHESLLQWGNLHTLIGLYILLLSPAGELAQPDEGTISGQMGMLYGRIGDLQQSELFFQYALSLQRAISDQAGEAITLTNLGELLRINGKNELAQMNLEYALLLSQQQHNLPLQGIIFHNLGLLTQGNKNYEQAFNYYLEALRIAHERRDEHNQGLMLTNMGLLLYEQGLFPEGMAILLTALKLRTRLRDTTVIQLELFLKAIEQKMGPEPFTYLCNEAMAMQQQTFSRFVPIDMRQLLS